jgi:O-antigen/teichoic acid export membrane protein
VTESSPYQPQPMSGANAEREVRRGIRSMRLAIVAQAVLYLALAGFVWSLAATVDDLGDATWPLVVVSVNAALLVVLVVFSVLLSRRERKILFTIIWLECAFIAIILIGLIVSLVMSSASGGPTGTPVGLFVWGGLMLAMLRPLQKPELRMAFGLPPIQPRQKKPKK